MPIVSVEQIEAGQRNPFANTDVCSRCMGQYAYISDGKGLTILACGSCGHPAPDDHPDQIALKRAAEEAKQRQKQEKQQSESLAKAQVENPYRHVGMMAMVEERFAEIERRLAIQNQTISDLQKRLAAVEARKK